MYRHPGLAQALIQDSVTERQRSDGANRRGQDMPWPRLAQSVRHATGWLLVDLGLRLAAPRNAIPYPAVRSKSMLSNRPR